MGHLPGSQATRGFGGSQMRINRGLAGAGLEATATRQGPGGAPGGPPSSLMKHTPRPAGEV